MRSSVPFGVHQDPYLRPLLKASSQHSVTPQPAVVHGVAPSQVQDLTFLFVELPEAPFPSLSCLSG